MTVKSFEPINIGIYTRDGKLENFLTEALHHFEIKIFDKEGTILYRFNLPDREFNEIEKSFPVLKSEYPQFDEKGHLYFAKIQKLLKRDP